MLDCFASNDVRIRFPSGPREEELGREVGNKKQIKEFTFRAQREARLQIRAAFEEQRFNWVLTLTYPGEVLGVLDGKQSKKHLDRFLDVFQKRLGRIHYVWMLEFQGNGNPHYHVAFKAPLDVVFGLHEWISKAWARICRKILKNEENQRKHEKAGTQIAAIKSLGGCSNYFASYMVGGAKHEQKKVPEHFKNVGRFWGHSRGCITKQVQHFVVEDDGAARKVTRNIERFYNKKLQNWFEKAGRVKKKTKRIGNCSPSGRGGAGGILWDSLRSVHRLLEESGQNISMVDIPTGELVEISRKEDSVPW